MTMLLSLLDPTSPYADYYSRLYSVQILSSICAARPERLQECILNVPLGVSRLVGVLDDSRDAVRNAGLLLLVDLTSGANEDLRKIVAFEDVFGKIFALIRAEGGLAEAGITAQDCLSLLANLIRASPSNQTMFRESGYVAEMARLLEQAFPPSEPEAAFAAQAREKAAWGLLQLLSLFFEPGEKSAAQNQTAFFRAGTAQVLIDLGFSIGLPSPILTLALKSAAALISSNAPLQEAFAGMQVDTSGPSTAEPKAIAQTNGTRSGAHSARGSARPSAERPRQYIIEALLDLTLSKAQDDPQLRSAGCTLIKAYLTNHDRIKAHFLQRAIAGHAEHETAANVLNTLLSPNSDVQAIVYASWIISVIVVDELDAKAALAAVKEGDESAGEDVLTFIQALGSQLQGALQAADESLVTAYAGLLIVLLWEFADGVNNLLAEGSGLLQALVAAASPILGQPVTSGIAVVLLGTIYEFSTKDSPIPRRTLAPLLTQKLKRSKYLDALTQLRRHPAVRDFGVDDNADELVLSDTFVDLFMSEYYRLRKAIDKDPGVEVLPPSAAEAGVDRDVLDDLRQQLQSTKDALSQAQQDALAKGQQHEQDRMTATKDLQTVTAEVERLRKINQAMQAGHESELEKLTRHHENARQQLQDQHQRASETAKRDAERALDAKLREQGAASAQKMQDHERRIVELGNTHRSEQSKHVETVRQLESLTARHAELGTSEQKAKRELADLSQRHERVSREHQQAQSAAETASAELARVRDESEKRQELVARFTSQVKELREELKGREDELATERAGFADLEKELENVKAQLAGAEKAAAAGPVTPAVDDEKVKALEAQVNEAKEGEKGAKEELESMLLVMAEIEEKRDAYRAKVKELGGDVTEDEDDEEGDGEDEEEEDEEDGDVD
jgi:intracellular protein transport protein USO1